MSLEPLSKSRAFRKITLSLSEVEIKLRAIQFSYLCL